MHWLYLLFAFGALLIAITTAHTWVLALCLVAALALVGAWARTLYLARAGGGTRDVLTMIDPDELRRLRELAEAKRNGESGTAADTSSADRTPPHSA
ncbi:hypothetical protein [Pseudoxanthomonas koreensis]|uniref:hypothetical protein n=1 Tax=Pseudoxanthomonas koreensis TaxID=266061 RepID=UPI0035A5F401